ncbi:MAG: acyltransferase family protein [Terricaulis sp.]
MQHRPEIDGLRAIAIIPVLLFHAGIGAVSGGYVGVDVFFVISGYLITRLIREDLEAGRFSILGFYNRRIRRILPALVFVVVATIVAALLFLTPTALSDFSKSLASVSAFASNFYFWKASGYFENSALLRPLLHTWSLAVEEQFYIFMPIAAYLVHRYFRKRWLAIFAAAAISSFALSMLATQRAPTANFFLLPTRAWELLVGALLAGAALPAVGALARQALSLAGLTLICWAVFAYNEATPFPGVAALAPCLGACLIIAFADARENWIGRVLASKPMVAIGLISYSLYLVHWPIAVFWRTLTLRAPDVLDAACIIALSLAIAAFSWRFVEQPFRKRGGASNAKVIAIGVAALAALGALGVFGWATNGLPQRFPAQARVETAREAEALWRNGICFYQHDIPYESWRPERCVSNPNGEVPVLLWGDSFAAHYVPGILQAGGRARVYQYTAAGCPPVLSYYSYALPQCQGFNQNALRIIDELNIKRVILSARWVNLRRRGLDGLRSTLDALAQRDVEVFVIGQSPMFITAVPEIVARTGEDAWSMSIDPSINDALRAVSADAHFIDPIPSLCRRGECRLRAPEGYLYWDDGHFTELGAAMAVRAYVPLD